MVAPGSPVTDVETVLEKFVDFIQNRVNDPVFMADLENFLKLAGDWLETQIGETSGTTPAAAYQSPAVSYPPAAQAPGVNYYGTPGSSAQAQASVAQRKANPTVKRY